MILLSPTDSLSGVAGTGSAVTYTILADIVNAGVDAFQTAAQNQLPSSVGTLIAASAGNQRLIKTIFLTNTTGSQVSGIKFFINGTAATNQLVTIVLPANASAIYEDGVGWTVYDATGLVVTTSSVTLTGDVTGSGAGTIATTLKNTGPGATGPLGSATATPIVTIDAQGRVTALTSTTVTPAVGSITGLGTGVATFLATPSSANLASAVTDETGTGALVFANTAVMEPKDIAGRVYVDPTNTQGWAGADAGAWINSAYSYIHTTYSDNNGGVIELAPGSYSYSTPIVLANAGLMSIIMRGAGDGNGATILNYTAATATNAIAIGGGSGNDGGVQLENFTITGTALGNTATAIQIGVVGTAGVAGSTIKNVSIRRFTNGINWATTSIAYAAVLINVKIQQCTNGLIPFGENNVMLGGLIGGNTNGIVASGACEMQLFGVAFDDNTTTGINISNSSARMSLDGVRFENAGGGTSVYITQSNGSISMVSGAFQNDTTSGTPATGFVQMTGGIAKYDGVWHGMQGAQAFTQVYNASTPAGITVINPIISPGSNVATGLSGMNWLPNAYDQAITAATATSTTTETIIKQRIVPLNTTDVGTTFRITAYGTQVTATTSLIWKLHYGPLGTVSDPIAFTTALVAVATTAGGGVSGLATIRTVGATGTIIGGASAQGTAPAGATTTATVLANSTQTNILTLTATTTAGTFTVQVATIEQMQPN